MARQASSGASLRTPALEHRPANPIPAQWKPSAKYDHVFVVVRLETEPAHPDQPLERRIATTRALWTKEEAEAEVERLNRLNKDKGCLYVWGVARLTRQQSES
jgi:hypothetical protein